MLINGEWLECDDGVIRPSVKGMVRLVDGRWVEVTFLLDAGADRTVFSARYLHLLTPLAMSESAQGHLAGVGGAVDSITIETAIGFVRDDDRPVRVRGSFHVFAENESSDLSVFRPRRNQQFRHHLRLSEPNRSPAFTATLLRNQKGILSFQAEVC